MRRAGVWRIVILTLNGEGPNSARCPQLWSVAVAKPLLAAHPEYTRVVQEDWTSPRCEDWIRVLE